MATTVEDDLLEEIKRKQAEDALSLSGDDSSSQDADFEATLKAQEKTDKQLASVKEKYGDWETWPTYPIIAEDQPEGLPSPAAPAVTPAPTPNAVPAGHIDLTPPKPQTPPGLITDPESGTRYVVDQESGAKVPYAELATEEDKKTFQPTDVTLPERTVEGTAEAPDKLTQVERAERVGADPDPDYPDYKTSLTPKDEVQFQRWVKQNNIPFDDGPYSDYDMRGFWKAAQEGDPNAKTAVSKFDGRVHFTDTYKTPFHRTFSNESMYATNDAPHWEGDRLIDADGNVVADETPGSKPAPGTLTQVEKAQPVRGPAPSTLTQVERALPTGPKAPGTHTELAPPGQMDLRPDELPAEKPVVAQPAAPPPPSTQAAVKPVADDWRTWTTADGTSAEPTTTTTTTREAPPSTQPNGSNYPERTQAVGDKDPAAFIVHHTSGRGTVDGVVSTLRERGLGVQYVMDRDGNIFATGGPGAQNIKTGWGKGEGLSNQNVVGMEIIANDDKDVTPAQAASFARFIAARYPNTPLFGHGEVNPGHKEADEGLTAKAAALAYRAGNAPPSTDPTEQLDGQLGGLLKNKGSVFIEMGNKYGVDPKLIAAIAMFETGNGTSKLLQTHNNIGGLTGPGHTGVGGDYMSYDSLDSGIEAAAQRLRTRYLDQGFNTIAKIGAEWAPVDAKNDPQGTNKEWPGAVSRFYMALGGGGPSRKAEEPPKQEWESWATLSPAEQAKAEANAQQNTLTALQAKSKNLPDWYHALENPIPGVSDAVRNATREDFKQQITAYAQDYYKEADPDKAFQRIMQAPNLLTSAGEILSKAPAHVQHALLAFGRGLDANGENQITNFINVVHPEATPEARAGFVREILSKPAGDERTRFVSALYASVDPQITQGIDLPTLLDSIDTISQPGYQEKRQADIKAAVAKNLKDLRTDPTMENTWGGTISDAIAQMPKNLGEALFPVIGQSAMTSEIYFDTLDGLRKEHPDWSEDQLKAKAGAASVPQVVLQEVVNLATMGLGGGLVKGITNPVQRIAANSILHGGIAATAGSAQQVVANVATGRPVTEGLPQAAIAGGIQGVLGGALHVPEGRERPIVPEVVPLSPEAPPVRQPVSPADILGPDVRDTSVPWYRPGPIVTRGVERTTFTPEELVRATATLPENATPEEIRAAVEALQPPTDFTNREVFVNSAEAQQAEIAQAQAAQAPSPVNLENAIREEQIRRALTGEAPPGAMATPPKVPQGPVRGVGEAEPWISKIANRFMAERIAKGDIGPVEPGHGEATEALVARGSKMGPETVAQHVSNLMHDVGGNPVDQAAAVRFEEARLSQRSHELSNIAEANPNNQQAKIDAEDALKYVTDFHKNSVAKLKNNWHKMGMTLQGDVPVDLSNYNGLREEFFKNTGKMPPSETEPVLRNAARKVRGATAAQEVAMKKLGAEINKEAARRPLPTHEQVKETIAKRMRGEFPCPT